MQADALNCMFLVMMYMYIMCSAQIKVPMHPAHAVCQLFLVRNMACKRKRLRSDTKAVVCNVYDYFERESKKNKKIHQGIVKLKKKTVDATGLSKRTVDVILAEKRSLGDGKFESPRKRYKKSRIRVDPDDFDVSAIRRTVLSVQASFSSEVLQVGAVA